MALETGTHINDLNAANPVSTDAISSRRRPPPVNQGDHAGHVPEYHWRNERHAYGAEHGRRRRHFSHLDHLADADLGWTKMTAQ